MERKSLGRGLNDISDIFLSELETEDVKGYNETLSEISSILEQNESCNYCTNFIEKFSDPKCKIFTFQNEIYTVPYMEKITPRQAKYCKFFNPIPTRKTDRLLNKNSEPTDTEHEVEEIVKVARKIVYPDAPYSQKWLKKSIVEHLKEGFEIKSCELRKTDNISTKGKKESKEVALIICTKET